MSWNWTGLLLKHTNIYLGILVCCHLFYWFDYLDRNVFVHILSMSYGLHFKITLLIVIANCVRRWLDGEHESSKFCGTSLSFTVCRSIVHKFLSSSQVLTQKSKTHGVSRTWVRYPERRTETASQHFTGCTGNFQWWRSALCCLSFLVIGKFSFWSYQLFLLFNFH